MHILAIGNQKGGTSKTTTAGVLAVLLSRQGSRVHVIDMDPQASLTSAFGMRDEDGLLYQAMQERSALPVIPIVDNLTLSPSSVDLARGESEYNSHGRVISPAAHPVLNVAVHRIGAPRMFSGRRLCSDRLICSQALGNALSVTSPR